MQIQAMAARIASLLVVGFIMVIITKVINEIGVSSNHYENSIFERINFHGVLGFVVCILITLVRSNDADASLNQVQMMHHQQKKNQ